MKIQKLTPRMGVLPILQECPCNVMLVLVMVSLQKLVLWCLFIVFCFGVCKGFVISRCGVKVLIFCFGISLGFGISQYYGV